MSDIRILDDYSDCATFECSLYNYLLYNIKHGLIIVATMIKDTATYTDCTEFMSNISNAPNGYFCTSPMQSVIQLLTDSESKPRRTSIEHVIIPKKLILKFTILMNEIYSFHVPAAEKIACSINSIMARIRELADDVMTTFERMYEALMSVSKDATYQSIGPMLHSWSTTMDILIANMIPYGIIIDYVSTSLHPPKDEFRMYHHHMCGLLIHIKHMKDVFSEEFYINKRLAVRIQLDHYVEGISVTDHIKSIYTNVCIMWTTDLNHRVPEDLYECDYDLDEVD